MSQKRMNARHSSLLSASSPASHCMLNSSTNTLCLLRNRWCIAENTSCPPKSKMDMSSAFLPPSPPLLISSSNLNKVLELTALAATFAQLLVLVLLVLLVLVLVLMLVLVLVLVLMLVVLVLVLVLLMPAADNAFW